MPRPGVAELADANDSKSFGVNLHLGSTPSTGTHLPKKPLAKFSDAVAAALLADCKRHCCVCFRWAGQRMHIHHIVADAEGGSGEYDNGIPVCLDCHAEVESKSNMGRRFTAEELKMHRDRWMTTVREHPDVLVRAAQTLTETGPLEALFSEMEFNRTAIIGGIDDPYPPLTVKQFERAISTNALAALDESTRDNIQRTYADVYRLNYHFEELARMERRDGSGGAFAATTRVRNDLKMKLQGSIPQSMQLLAQTLEWDVYVPNVWG